MTSFPRWMDLDIKIYHDDLHLYEDKKKPQCTSQKTSSGFF